LLAAVVSGWTQGVAEVKYPAGERAGGSPEKEEWDLGRRSSNDVLPLIERNLTLPAVAERLDISVEAACAVVVAALRGKHEEEDRRAKGGTAQLREAGFEPVGEEGLLWERDGVCYGREAASQKAWRDLREGEEDPSG